jgi:hypothetical protein
MHAELYSGNVKGRNDVRDLGVGGRIILKWILN